MSCFICAAKFSWRRKELECKNCHKAVCKDCLNKKLVIPKLGPNETLVCTKCFNESKKNTDMTVNGGHGPPPAYDEPNQYFGPSMKDIVTSKNQVDPDVELRGRLNQLKEKTVTPLDVDVEEKFHNVTGRSASSGGSNIITPKPKLTEDEEVLKLLEQTSAEVNIDNTYAQNTKDKIDDMEKRLLKLKGIDPDKVERKPVEYLDTSSEDECEAIDKIIKKCALVPPNNPGETTTINISQVPKQEEEEELPWCCICNDDASIRCHDCDGDLYCRRCFREGHNDYDTKSHINSAFKAKQKR